MAIFLLTWIRPWLGYPLAIAGSWLVLTAFRKENGKMLWMDAKKEVFLALALLSAVVMAGIGGFFYPNSDQLWRTPIFMTAVEYPWPVYGDGNTIFCYFWGFWVVPALVAKATGVYMAGYVMQTLWAWIGLWLGMRLLFEFVGRAGLRVLLILLFFDGLTIFFIYIHHKVLLSNLFILRYLNTWSFLYPASLPDCLSQIYNQMLASLIATMLVLGPGRRGRGALVLACTVFQAPFTCLTLFFVVVWEILKSLKGCGIKQGAGRIFSVWNLLSVAIAFPIIYYSSLNDSEFSWVWEVSDVYLSKGYTDPLWGILFIPLIMGIWVPLVWNRVKRSPVFWIIFMAPQIAFFFWLGIQPDLSSRMWLPYSWMMTGILGREVFRWKRHTRSRRRLLIATGIVCSVYTLDLGLVQIHDAMRQPYEEWRIGLGRDVFEPGIIAGYHFVGKVPEGDRILRPAPEKANMQ